MSWVFVVDPQKHPLDPVHPGRARFLLNAGHAAVFRRYPFVIILKEEKPDTMPSPLRLKIDPGAKTTGLAILNEASGQAVWAGELTHRGQRVKENMDQRRDCRRSRRQRHTRYRPRRFENRKRPEGWLPPSLESRIANVLTWVARLSRWCPLAAISQELARFDTQLLQNPEICSIEYQQGELAGYEIREYLLEKFGRTCVYCKKTNVRLQIDHQVPRSRSGSSRVSNLVTACEPCTQEKGNRTAAEFGHPEVAALAKAPVRDAAAVNTTRWALYHRLQGCGLVFETGTGGQTKWNRTQRNLPKTTGWMRAVSA